VVAEEFAGKNAASRKIEKKYIKNLAISRCLSTDPLPQE
jgi:hypothetical protein